MYYNCAVVDGACFTLIVNARQNHPDVSVYLQKLWDVLREPGDNLFWETQARDRVSWKQFTSKVSSHLGSNLHEVDLFHCQLLVVGPAFHLLPMRHFPMEDLYDSCLRVVPETDAYSDLGAWVIPTDGSCRNGHGGFCVVLQAPHQKSCVKRSGYLAAPCTNRRAELRALHTAFEMIRILLPRTAFGTVFHVLTDSQLCLQLLMGFMVPAPTSSRWRG